MVAQSRKHACVNGSAAGVTADRWIEHIFGVIIVTMSEQFLTAPPQIRVRFESAGSAPAQLRVVQTHHPAHFHGDLCFLRGLLEGIGSRERERGAAGLGEPSFIGGPSPPPCRSGISTWGRARMAIMPSTSRGRTRPAAVKMAASGIIPITWARTASHHYRKTNPRG